MNEEIFYSAEGLNPITKWQVIHGSNWFKIGSNGQWQGHPISPNNPQYDFGQGDVIVGREKTISYKSKDNWMKMPVIEISGNRYVRRQDVLVHKGDGKPTGDSSRDKARKCRTVNPDGTVVVYECPTYSNFFGGEVMSKIGITSDMLIIGLTFGAMGTAIGFLLGGGVKTVIPMTSGGIAVGALIGYGKV